MTKKFIENLEFEWGGLDEYINEYFFSDFIGKPSKSFVKVKLPDFVNSYGLSKNELYFPLQYVTPHKFEDIVKDYEKCNWLGAIEYLVKLNHEKQPFFKKVNPTSSSNYPDDLYSVALVNRYLLFLRDFIAFNKNKADTIGKTPKPKIVLTHDVDAIQSSNGLKVRQFFQNKEWPSFQKNENLQFFKEIIELEKKYNATSIFFFSAYRPYFSLPLLDPKYNLENLKETFEIIIKNNFEIGIHPGILSSIFSRSLRSEIKKINSFLSANVTSARNHWLSFFNQRTWKIQKMHGIKKDYTLGFNNIPGFRNFCILKYYPYKNLVSIPTIIMDGHFFNFGYQKDQEIIDLIKPYIQELKNVGGIASIDFHQRFFHEFYGYKDVYTQILKYLDEEGLL